MTPCHAAPRSVTSFSKGSTSFARSVESASPFAVIAPSSPRCGSMSLGRRPVSGSWCALRFEWRRRA